MMITNLFRFCLVNESGRRIVVSTCSLQADLFTGEINSLNAMHGPTDKYTVDLHTGAVSGPGDWKCEDLQAVRKMARESWDEANRHES